MILQDCTSKGIILRNQEDYYRVYSGYSEEDHRVNFEKFYKTRSYLLENYSDFWFRQNRLYDGSRELLNELSSNCRVFILSTKKSSFISEILTREKVEWPLERILLSSSSEKIPVIESYLEKDDTAVLIDDQSEYFKKHPRISFYLAEWGYVSDLKKSSVSADRVVSLSGFRDCAAPWLIRNCGAEAQTLPD